MDGNDYVNFLISGAIEIPAYIFVHLTMDRWGRRCLVSGMLILSGVSLLLTTAVPVNSGNNYNDVIMRLMASEITSLTIVYSTVYWGPDQRKHQNSPSLAFVRGIYRWPVNSLRKRPVSRKMFPIDDVINNQPQTKCIIHGMSAVHWLVCHSTRAGHWGKGDVWMDYAASQTARFMGPTWGPSGADRTQVSPMLVPWTLLSGMLWAWIDCNQSISFVEFIEWISGRWSWTWHKNRWL